MQKAHTPEFRVSFPSVFKARSFNNGDPKFSITMLFKKGTDLTELKKLAAAAAKEKWPTPESRPKKLRNPFRDGDTEKADMDGYAGHIFVSASSKMAPGVVDRNRNPIDTDTEFYAGCYAHATVTAYAYNQKGNAGVAFGLQNVQKLRDGEPFSGRSKAEDDFEDLGGSIDSLEGASLADSPATDDIDF